MDVRKFVEVDDEVYLAVATKVGTDGTGVPMPFARAFKLYRGGEEVDLDTLSDMAVFAIYCELDGKLADAWGDAEIAKKRAEQRARRAKIFKQ